MVSSSVPAMCFAWVLGAVLGGSSVTPNSGEVVELQETQPSNRTGSKIPLLQRQRRMVYDGSMISSSEWSTQYDFVVRVTGPGSCTGTVWGNKVLTAAHCGYRNDNPGRYVVETVYGSRAVSKLDFHPEWQPGVNQAVDYMILTLSSPVQNKQKVAFKSTDLPEGFNVVVAGMGRTIPNSPSLPAGPVVSVSLPIQGRCYNYPTTCYGRGPNGSCKGDSGGPVLYWDVEECETHSWPKSRSCAISLGVRAQAAREYKLGSAASNDCPSGYRNVATTGECQAAALAVGLADFTHSDQAHTANSRPKGCFAYDFRGTFRAYLNPNPGAPSSPSSCCKPVCVQKSLTFVGGSGTWCSSVNGGQRLSLQESVADCTTGGFQGFKAPCVGVVFNGPQPGDTGSAYGRYTTCWRNADSGKGWQVLLKPTEHTSGTPGTSMSPAATAVVVGPVSGSSGGDCGSPNARYHYSSIAGAVEWIKSVAPDFQWVE